MRASSGIQVREPFGKRHFQALGVEVHFAQIDFGEGDQDFSLSALDNEQRRRSSGSINVFDLAYDDQRIRARNIDQRAADQVADVDLVFRQCGAFAARNRDNQAGQLFRIRNGVHAREMQNDTAFVQPVILQLDLAGGGKRGRSGTRSRFLRTRRGGRALAQQPKLPPLGKFFREVSQDFGEDLAFASLRVSDACQPDP